MLALLTILSFASCNYSRDEYVEIETTESPETDETRETIDDYKNNQLYSGGYTYSILKDGTIEIIDYRGTEQNLTIPTTIDGKSVSQIGGFAFESNDTIVNLTIPYTVTFIEFDAFSFCTKLKTVIIPGSVRTIGESTFYGCDNLEKVINYAFGCNELLTEINIPDNVKYIGEDAFYNCSSLEK